jgi:nucleoside-diphosphate-sugar epimerase
LVAQGHEIIGLARTEDKARLVEALGATPIVGDLFNFEFLREAVGDADVIMHLATAIPKKRRPQRKDWKLNDELRREGTRYLIEAAREHPRHAFILQSVAFLYGDRHGEWVTEDAPPRNAWHLQSAVDAEKMSLAAYDEFALPVVVLRGAQFYGPDAYHTRLTIDSVRKRAYPIIGSGEQYWHWVYVDDMARACVCAAENPAPGEIFFVADDWPFHARDLLNYLAAHLHAPRPFAMSVRLARLLAGDTATFLAQSVRFRTDKIKKMLGWTPRYPTYREGFAEILRQMGVRA